MSHLISNIDGSRPLIPCMLYTTAVNLMPSHAWGEFDGVYWTIGQGSAPQAIVRRDSFDHLMVNNMFRTGTQHFAAIRLD
jgi:hypothetical protein